jgi:hypothetical protein
MIQVDSDIMGGAPVFRGTRIPIHLIAEMIEGCPSLTRETVESAGIYATAHPRRGRPPEQPWSGRKPTARKKVKLQHVAYSQTADR